jgi:arginine N-succinyltransferase
MMYLRPIEARDLHDLIELNRLSGVGMTNFPKDPSILEQKIFHSQDSFAKEVLYPDKETYLFALMDPHLHKIVGISAIFATTGGGEPTYFYRREKVQVESPLSAVVKEIPLLSPISYVRGPSEICSLFLHPHYRKTGLGRLLSLARFHFMAAFPKRFTNSVYTELRGLIENNTSAFWEGIGKHFFNCSFLDALEMLKYGRSFISHFLPKNPIYVNLLPKEVQEVIGKTHPDTQGALNMLLSEGFTVTDEVDIFDAGPKLRALKSDIRTIQTSEKLTVVEIKDFPTEKPSFLVSNEHLEFRACLAFVAKKSSTTCALSSEACKALHIGLGDSVRLSSIHAQGETV